MKIDWNSKYKTISVYVIITATIVTIIILLLINLASVGEALSELFKVLMPFIVGLVAAYLLYRPARNIEKHWFKFIEKRKPHPALRRGLSILVLFIIVFGALFLIIYSIIPQLYESFSALFVNLPGYLDTLEKTIIDWFKSVDLYTEETALRLDEFSTWLLSFTNILDQLLTNLPDVVTSIGTGILNFFIGMIVCVYFLYTKEKFNRQAKKLIFALFSKRFAEKFVEMIKYSNNVLLGFIMGTVLSSAFVGITTFIFMTVVGLPYAMLISVIITLTNIIPMFGPFIGAIPSAVILLMVDPIYALIFVIFIVVIQQIDGNYILPQLIGMQIGLSAFWVLFAIIIGGGLFGVWGLVLSVPIFAIIYSFVAALINNALEKKCVPPEQYIYPSNIIKEINPDETKFSWRNILKLFKKKGA